MAASIVRENGEVLTFDAVTDITYTPTIATTDHPIEDGSTITDHAQKQPLLVTITAIVSESPFKRTPSTTGGVGRVLAARDFFAAIVGELVSIVDDRLGTAENCLLTRYPHSVTRARHLEFVLEFKQVIIATAGYVSIPADQPTPEASVGFADEQDQGTGATNATSTGSTAGGAVEGPAQEEADKSLLLSLLEYTGAL